MLKSNMDIRCQYSRKVDALLKDTIDSNQSYEYTKGNLRDKSTDELNDIIVGTLKNATKLTVPMMEKESKYTPWEDQTYQILIARRKTTRKRDERNKLEKQIKNVRKNLKKKYYKSMASEINQHHIDRDIEKIFSKAKSYSILRETRQIQ